jgi:hypothetical protein
MNKSRILLALPVLAAGLTAQCYESNLGILAPIAAGQAGYGDDVFFDLQPMNISFPLSGLAATYTHAHISSNGVIYLTNGAPSSASTAYPTGYPSLTTLLGAAGSDPRVAACWTDLDNLPANGGGVYINNTIPGKFVVTWLNTTEWATTPTFTVQAQLYANGRIDVFHNATTNATITIDVGVSPGNGATGAGVNLSAGGNSSTNHLMYERFLAGTFDLQARTTTFTPNGAGFVQSITTCNSAFHQKYGNGCYDLSDSFYQYLPDATTAPATLNGQSMVLTPVGANYLVQWGGGTYVAPGAGAAVLPIADDGEFTQLLSTPLPTPSGPVGTLFIHGNAMISHASNNGIQPANYYPDVNGFLNAPATGFFSWHDYNPTEGGQIKYEEVVVGTDTIAYITYDNVESYASPEVPNPSTLQFQLNLTTGVVTYVWVSIDGNPTSPFGSQHLIGWGPIGVSADGGNLNLATALPFVTSSANVDAMELDAAPAPISTATSGATVVYTTSNIPEFTPGAGVYIAMNILSLGQIPGGLDLGIIGAPGCNAYVQTLDFTQTMIGGTSTMSVNLNLPAGVAAGTQIYAQSAALVAPNSLPNGQNAFGLTVSNGVRSYIAPF